jgi:hypothetical protein
VSMIADPTPSNFPRSQRSALQLERWHVGLGRHIAAVIPPTLPLLRGFGD